MCESGHCLHLNGISLIQWVIEYSWRVDYLPTLILIISVTHEEVLRCESIGLHFHISIRNIVHETRLSHVGKTGYNESPCICIDLR